MSKTNVLFLLLLLFACCFYGYLDLIDTAIPYDDAYTAFMVKSSYAEIVKITAADVHPPLYYWGLKLFCQLFGDSIFSLRLFSSLGVIATLLFGSFSLKKIFGDKVSLFFILLMILFPVTQFLVTEVRMYSWTMFFVFVCGLYAFKLTQKDKNRDWIFFFVSGICAAYLHNYGLLSIIGIYVILFICIILQKKNKKKLLFCTLLFIIAYTPWIFQLATQIGAVSSDYWIKPLTLNDFFLHIYYFYSPKEVWLPFTEYTKTQMMIGLTFLMGLQLFLTVKIFCSYYKNKRDELFIVIGSYFAFLFPIIAGALISVTYIPILVTRYMTCSFGFFILGTAFVLAQSWKYPLGKKLVLVFLLLLTFDAGMRFYSGQQYYNNTERAYENLRTFSEKVNTDRKLDFVVNDFSYHVLPRLQLIAPDNNYLVLSPQEKSEDYSPFRLKQVDETTFYPDEFVLIHQEREAIQAQFRIYKTSLINQYIVVDSLHATDFYLYYMKKLEIIN